MQKTSPSSFELPGVSAADGEGEAGSAEAAREDAGVGDLLSCFFSFDVAGRLAVIGVALGDRNGVLLSDAESTSASRGFFATGPLGLGLAVPFFVIAAGNGFVEDSGAGRFLPATDGVATVLLAEGCGEALASGLTDNGVNFSGLLSLDGVCTDSVSGNVPISKSEPAGGSASFVVGSVVSSNVSSSSFLLLFSFLAFGVFSGAAGGP